jgi:hypothetical protein
MSQNQATIEQQKLARKIQALESKFSDFENQFAALARQSVANASAGIDAEKVPIVSDLGYFTGEKQFLAPKGLCPLGHAQCFLFRFPDGDELRLIHVRYPPAEFFDGRAPLTTEQQADYALWLSECALAPMDPAELRSGVAANGQHLASLKAALEKAFSTQSQDRKPSVLRDGTAGIAGHNVDQNQPGIVDPDSDASGGELIGNTNPKVGGGPLA